MRMNAKNAVPETLESVFLRDRVRLLTFLNRAGAGDEAEDLLQEAWLRIEALRGRELPEQPLSYLYRLLHNLMLDRRRGAMRSTRRDTEWADISGSAALGISDDPGSERRMIAEEEVRAIHAAVEALGEPTATIFRRHRIDGVVQRRIAEEQGLGISTVEKHLRRAYATLLAWRRARDEA